MGPSPESAAAPECDREWWRARDPDWVTVRPPLVELTAEQQRTLVEELTAAKFDMPGLAG